VGGEGSIGKRGEKFPLLKGENPPKEKEPEWEGNPHIREKKGGEMSFPSHIKAEGEKKDSSGKKKSTPILGKDMSISGRKGKTSKKERPVARGKKKGREGAGC